MKYISHCKSSLTSIAMDSQEVVSLATSDASAKMEKAVVLFKYTSPRDQHPGIKLQGAYLTTEKAFAVRKQILLSQKRDPKQFISNGYCAVDTGALVVGRALQPSMLIVFEAEGLSCPACQMLYVLAELPVPAFGCDYEVIDRNWYMTRQEANGTALEWAMDSECFSPRQMCVTLDQDYLACLQVDQGPNTPRLTRSDYIGFSHRYM